MRRIVGREPFDRLNKAKGAGSMGNASLEVLLEPLAQSRILGFDFWLKNRKCEIVIDLFDESMVEPNGLCITGVQPRRRTEADFVAGSTV